MRRPLCWIVLGGLAAVMVGCGDSSSGTGGTPGTGGSGGSGGSPTMMVNVSGSVSAAALVGEPTPLEGATVTVPGTSSTATTTANGSFSIRAPAGTTIFMATANGTWGSMLAEDIPETGFSGLELEVLPEPLVNAVADSLGVTADPSKGIVAVFFDEDTVSPGGGETATISAESEISFVFDAEDNPVEGDTLLAGGGSDIIFINVDLSDSITVTARNLAGQDCPPEYPDASYSVEAKVFTEIDVACP